MAEEFMLAPNVTLVWVPNSGFANYLQPTAAEINAGLNLSCAVVTGYTLNPTDSPTDDSRSICDTANVDNFTSDEYEIEMTFFRSEIGNPTTVFTTAYTTFKKPDAKGYWVERIGKGNSATFAAGDEVSIYGGSSDWWRTVYTDENGGPIEGTVSFLTTAKFNQNYTLLT